MNRTNLCIRMLQLLKARGKMNTTQLATELEVNPRNIREFKKELVLAGYNVEEVKGRYGGYILNDEYDLPVTIFSDEQKDALVQYYNLDMIISVGYRLNSKKVTSFRRCATSILRNYMINGYTVNQIRNILPIL